MAGNENNLVSNEGLVDNLLTLLFGGFDTTSTALGYCLYKLAMHPEMQDTVAAEAIKVCAFQIFLEITSVGMHRYLDRFWETEIRLTATYRK